MKILKSINELKKISQKVVKFFDPVEENLIKKFEDQFGIKLPTDYVNFLQVTNGIELLGNVVYGIGKFKSENLDNIYYREHFQVSTPQFPHYVPFSPDGGGNFYCFDTYTLNENDSCEVKFWVSNYNYNDKDTPETTHESFSSWLDECLIGWYLEDFNYDGSPR